MTNVIHSGRLLLGDLEAPVLEAALFRLQALPAAEDAEDAENWEASYAVLAEGDESGKSGFEFFSSGGIYETDRAADAPETYESSASFVSVGADFGKKSTRFWENLQNGWRML